MRSLEHRFVFRRLGDAIAVFDHRTWQTHLLPPAAAVIVELMLDTGERLSTAQLGERIREDLDVSPDTPAISQFLRMLREIGILTE